ncbi:DUF3313 domain-containing protein [Colwellia psychrerythraea]|uniref:Putative lipoprotein n=1 Tax=Colwellia psychrerythraea (strain 34H / ATCC BAA-681) TaxID=167879 RepID=Q481J3_COLP3|nr:DUF3313 domain-containing protein [Colwellia psychrerythraea]AAZ24987.1 putative lipoprotein [Colwellia psychrerythraea 34H]
MLLKVQKRFSSVTTISLVTLLLSGCINITDQQHSGFLKNYEGFEDVYDPDYTKVYRSENFTIDMLADLKRVKLVPFEMWVTPSADAKFSPEELNELSQYFHQQMSARLSANNYEVVELMGPRTLIIQGAFSGVKFEDPELMPTDFVPFRMVMNAGNLAYLEIVDKQDVTTKVSVEIEFLKGIRRERVLAAISTKYVDTTIANSGEDNMTVVKELLDMWAAKFVDRLVEIRADKYAEA